MFRHLGTGEAIPVQLTWLNITDKAGSAMKGWAIIAHDRRAELAAQHAIAEREEQFRSAIELARQALEDQMLAHTEDLRDANQQLQDLNSYLQQSNSELEQYAYVASHDLQEPLRKISVFAGMLAKIEGLPDRAKLMAEKISMASVRMTQLIADLLDFSRLVRGENRMRPVDLNTVVQSVLTDFELQIAEKQALIHVDKLPTIEAVPLQMNQLFYNLISNSLKFTREGLAPEISIRCRRLDEGEHAIPGLHNGNVVNYFITIADNGIGFDSAYAEQIFEVFKRLHTLHEYPGSGIGLALCRRILQNHGGIMTAQSGVGTGTTISMILPSAQTAVDRPGATDPSNR
jgi:light-regulated signal transduction histidine kinase (bacteriophytochrome)